METTAFRLTRVPLPLPPPPPPKRPPLNFSTLSILSVALTPSLFTTNFRSIAALSRSKKIEEQDLYSLPKKYYDIQKRELAIGTPLTSTKSEEISHSLLIAEEITNAKCPLIFPALSCGSILWLTSAQVVQASEDFKMNVVYEIGELFELGIQLSYLLTLLGLLGVGTFFVIRQVLVRRELDLSAKELQEQVRSGDANATEFFELGAVMLRRKCYPVAIKYLVEAIKKWDGDDQDLAQVYNALGVSYIRDGKLEKGISQLETAVKLQPGYVAAWNNLGDAYEKKKELKPALKAFEEVLLFDPNNKIARPRRDILKEKVDMYKGVSFKSKQG